MSVSSNRMAGVLAAEHAPKRDTYAESAELEAIGRTRMEQARVDLLLDHPYFAAAVLALPMRGTSEPEIAKAVVTDGRRIVYRFDLVAALERPVVRLLIMHALLHVVLRHPERAGSRRWSQWTEACDIAVELLLAKLGVRRPDEVKGVEALADLSAEAIYDRIEQGAAAGFDSAQEAQDGLLPPPGCVAESNSPDGGDGAGATSERDAFERALLGTEVPSTMMLETVRREFTAVASQQVVARAGNSPGSGCSEIEAAAEEQVSWRDVLARFMREPIDRSWSLGRPNRKHLWRGLYLPGPMDVDGGRFVVAIDTSGSMSDGELGLVLTEIDAIRRNCACELTVLQFDAGLHATAEFSSWSEEDECVGSTKVMRVHGRGGTDLRLPFAWVAEERERGRPVSALIICTDGDGPLPDHPPEEYPVLFLLTPLHVEVPFGESVVLRKGGDRSPTAA